MSYAKEIAVETFSKLPPPGNPSNEEDGSPTHQSPGRSPAEEFASCSHKQAAETFFIDDEVEMEEAADRHFYHTIQYSYNITALILSS